MNRLCDLVAGLKDQLVSSSSHPLIVMKGNPKLELLCEASLLVGISTGHDMVPSFRTVSRRSGLGPSWGPMREQSRIT